MPSAKLYVTLTVLLLSAGLAQAALPPGSWITESLDPLSFGSMYPSSDIFIDDNGGVHLALIHSLAAGSYGAGVFYRYRPAFGAPWVIETVFDTNPISETWNPTIVVDGAGMPHIFFTYGRNNTIFYHARRLAPDVWSVDPVFSPPSYTYGATVDGNGTVHIVYEERPTSSTVTVHHAVYDGVAWISEQVSQLDITQGWPIQTIAVGVNQAQEVHIAFAGFIDDLVYHVTDSSGAWMTTLIATGYLGNHVEVDFSPADETMVYYYGSDAYGHVMVKDVTGWIDHQLPTSRNAASMSRNLFSVDASGQVHLFIVWSSGSYGVWHFLYDSNFQLLEYKPFVGDYSGSLALDADGQPHMVYWLNGYNRDGIYDFLLTEHLDVDLDGDGYAYNVDCNDNDATVYPGAPEVKHDGVDQDCNGYDLTIDVTKALWDANKDLLRVEATSALGEAAALNLNGFGPMRWKANKLYFSYTADPAGGNPGTVTVCGDEGCESAAVIIE